MPHRGHFHVCGFVINQQTNWPQLSGVGWSRPVCLFGTIILGAGGGREGDFH